MLTCKETARLISEGLDRKLSLWQRVNLRLHLMMCGACAAYRRQVETLNHIVRRRYGESRADEPETDAPPCPEEAKRRITESLRERTS